LKRRSRHTALPLKKANSASARKQLMHRSVLAEEKERPGSFLTPTNVHALHSFSKTFLDRNDFRFLFALCVFDTIA
jgi:hypothetical protein